jgi:hypothetical protein
MTSLDPHVLLITRPAHPSRAAVLLREGGYLVTKTVADHAAWAIQSSDPEAIVVDLPAFEEIAAMRVLSAHVPVLVLTNVPRLYPQKIGRRYALQRAQVEEDLISAVDRMLADQPAITSSSSPISPSVWNRSESGSSTNASSAGVANPAAAS